MKSLQGITILDISRLLPGGFASLLLSDLGARIIKVEQPGVGDYYRALFDGGGILGKGHVRAISQNKESLGLDLKDAEGRRIFEKLVRKADVVLENFRPGVLKKLRIDYSRLRRIKPSIILCSITGFGQSGSRKSLAGHDLNYLGLSGLLSRMRDREGRFVLPDFQIIDLAAGFDAAYKIAAALHQRGRTQKGSWIDCSMVGAGYSLARLYVSDRKEEKRDVSPVTGGLARYGVYESSDGKKLSLAALEPKFWIKFCEVIGKTAWAREVSFELDAESKGEALREIFRSKTAEEWTALGEKNDLCIFPIEEVDHLPIAPKKETPRLGQHTASILKSLGYAPNRIKALRLKKVVE